MNMLENSNGEIIKLLYLKFILIFSDSIVKKYEKYTLKLKITVIFIRKYYKINKWEVVRDGSLL